MTLTPTTVNDETMNRYVGNIKAMVRDATPDQRHRAFTWYPNAHDLALLIGDGNVRIGAGLLAALSVNKSWPDNQKLAHDAARGNVHGHMKLYLSRTREILSGKDPLLVLPEDSKTWNFYRAILDPHDPDVAVIDRHVHDAIVGETFGDRDRGLSNKRRYATMALALRIASRDLGMIPNDVQALIWTMQVDKVRGIGSRRKDTK